MNNMIEEWREVWNYPEYEVSNFGRVRRKKNGRIRIPDKWKGYHRVAFKHNKPIGVHRLVFEAFYRRLLPNEEAHHINQIRDCNLSTNLVAKDKSLHTHYHKLGNTYTKGRKHTEESKEIIRQVRLGTKQSQFTKQKRSESLKQYWRKKREQTKEVC